MMRKNSERGFSLITVLMVMGLILAVSTALAIRIQLDTKSHASFQSVPKNLALAEAGVNQGAAQFRNIFLNGNVPAGSDYALQSSSLGAKPIAYQLAQVGTNPTNRQLPLGQVPFGGLNVIQYNYSVASATPDLTNPSAQLRSQFQVNNIPVFQFLAYYTTNLEITPAPDMNLHGRIHSNADIYVNDGGTMTIRDNPPTIPTVQISAAGNLIRGRSDGGGCYGTVTIAMLQDANNDGRLDTRNLNCGATPVAQATIDQWLGSIRVNVPNIGLPTGYSTLRGAGNQYWDNADLRIVLDLTGANDYTQKRTGAGPNVALRGIVVQNAAGAVDGAKTASLRNFMRFRPGAIFYTDVPVSSNGGNTPCTTSAAATTYINPSYAAPASPCATANVSTAARYNPAFQADSFVYRRADSGNRPVSWTFGASSTNDQLGQADPANALGDYRRGGFFNNRENKWMYLLNVDLQELLAWNAPGGGGVGQLLDSTSNSNGGTVIFLSVIGGNSGGINNYGVRVFDSAQLPGYALNVTDPLGITVVSDQAMYVEGNYNSFAYAPTGTGPTGIPWTHVAAALIGDSMNVLSQQWEAPAGTVPNDLKTTTDLSSSSARAAASTTIFAAFASRVDNTNMATVGYNGGLENFPRFHEDWSGDTFTYRGSFVSLGTPLHANGHWTADGDSYNMYNPPARNWDYDPQLNDVAMLPPLTPTFVAVRQIVIGEDFR
jgi:hypothetical protein